jgi:thiol-disulfide isomerase/thioredoxin
MCAVVDVHEDWCGPCSVLEPTYRRLSLDFDAKQLRFCSLARGVMSEEQRKALPYHGCEPLIAVYKVRRRRRRRRRWRLSRLAGRVRQEQ